jgi:hypothetical protein
VPPLRGGAFHQPRRQCRDEIEAGVEFADAGLGHVCVEVRHPQQRAVAERREGIEDVVGGDRAQHAVLDPAGARR